MPSFLATFAVNSVLVIAAIWLYVRALMWVRNNLDGWARYSTGMLCYIFISVIIISSLVYVIRLGMPWWATAIGWVVSVVPGIWIFSKHDISL